MKIRLAEVREIVRASLLEMALPDHTREMERLWREYSSAVAAGGFEPVKYGTKYDVGWWKIAGEQFEIPELENADLLYFPQDTGGDDEPYGMYRNLDPTDDFNDHKAPPRAEVPESSRRYLLSFPYTSMEAVWSKQKFLRNLPKLVDRRMFYHEIGHLITARTVPPVPHVKNFHDAWKTPGDTEEIIGTTGEAFSELYAQYANSPKEFLRKYPTARDLVEKEPKLVKELENVSYSNRPIVTKDPKHPKVRLSNPDKKWVLRTIAKFHAALSGGK